MSYDKLNITMAEAEKIKTNADNRKTTSCKLPENEESLLQKLDKIEIPSDDIDEEPSVSSETDGRSGHCTIKDVENVQTPSTMVTGTESFEEQENLSSAISNISCNDELEQDESHCQSSGSSVYLSAVSELVAAESMKELDDGQSNQCDEGTSVDPSSGVAETSVINNMPKDNKLEEREQEHLDTSVDPASGVAETSDINNMSKDNKLEEMEQEHLDTSVDPASSVAQTSDINNMSKDNPLEEMEEEPLDREIIKESDGKVENDENTMSVEDSKAEGKQDSMKRSETCEFPSAPLSTPERTTIQQGLYGDLTSLISEDSPSNLKALTDAQLDTLYHNQQLRHNQQYVTGFLQEVKSFDKHEFYEIVLSYYRSRNQLATAQHDIEILKRDTEEQEDLVWQTQEFNMTAQGECADRARVTAPHKYEKQVYFPDATERLSDKLKEILNLLHDHLALSCYESQFSRLQVEVYLYRLYEKNPSWLQIAPGTPITAHVQRDSTLSTSLQPLRTCISILFAFQRKPVKDTMFLKDTQMWLLKLVSTFLRYSSLEDHGYLLNQILRCPAGVGKWGTQVIQPVVPPATYPGVLFGHPLLDHYVNMVSMLLMPVRQREEMLYQLQVTMTPPTDPNKNPWILLDSEGEEDEDPSNSWHFLQENDLVSLLNQLPLSTVFNHVLGISTDADGSEYYDPQSTCFSEGALLKLFAFATTVITVMKRGMDTYAISRYKQLNKRLARIISHVMSYISDHLESCRVALSLVSAATQERIQVEFDSLSFKAVTALVSANRFGAWQYLADLPYNQVSEAAIWRLLWKMHLSEESEGSNLDTLTTPECIEQIRNTDNLHTFEDRLTIMATSEALYLLNTFANMARSRSGNTLFVETVALEIYQIAFLNTHTREFCSRQGREMLSRVCDKHPQVLSHLLPSARKTLSCIGKVGIFLFSGLPLSLWKPSTEDFLILQNWLVEYPTEAVECQLARTILERLSWGMDKNPDGTDSGSLSLPKSVHYFIMISLARTYMTHLTGYPADRLFDERSKQGYLWGGETEVDKLAQWLWTMALRININSNDLTRLELVQIEPLPEIVTDENYLSVLSAKEKGFGIGYYFMLISTKLGHSVDDFCCDGLEYLDVLTEKGYMVPVLHAMSVILPLAYTPERQPRLINNTRFKKSLKLLLNHDESKRQMFSSEFPGPITHLFSSMIQRHIKGNYEQVTEKDIATFWIKVLTLNEWTQNRDVLYVLDNILRSCQRIPTALEGAAAIFKQLHVQQLEKGQSSGMLSWLAGSTGVPPMLEGPLCADFPWLMYHVIKCETNWEMETMLWPMLQEEMTGEEMQNVNDNVYKKVLDKLKLNKAPNLLRLSIYRWAEQIVMADISDSCLPLLCQNFFLLYLGRTAVPSGLQQRGSIGDCIFSNGRSLTMIKSMKQKLSDAAEFYQKMATAQDSDSEETAPLSNKSLYHTLVKFYRGLSYWLDEPRLHDSNLYIPSLPVQYEKARLSTVVQFQTDLWLDLLDWSEIDAQLTKLYKHWTEYFSIKDAYERKDHLSGNENNISGRLFNRLNSYDMPLPPPSIEQMKRPVAELPPTLICDKQNLIHSLRADFESLSGYAKNYDQRTQKHVALDCSFLELLPELHRPRHNEITVSIACRSMINPLHRCKGPAAAKVAYTGTARDDVTSRKLTENRAEYKQLLIESILPPGQHLCSSAVHVETTITELIKLYKTTNNANTKAEMQEVGCTLFYNVAAYVSEVTKYYPPTRQFFSLCLDTLGQEFIRDNRSQAQPLLQAILQNPILVNMMASNFSPNASPELFITMYEDLIPVPVHHGPDVALTLLTKFGVGSWMLEPCVGQPQRRILLGTIARALGQCGQRPSKQTRTICEVYKNHLTEIYEFQFPELYKDGLEVLLSGGSSGDLLVQVWEDFVQSLFSDPDGGVAPVPLTQIGGNDVPSATSSKTRLQRLSYQQILESLEILSSHFNNLRLGSMSKLGLYPRWRAYIEPLSILMNALCRSYILWNVKWVQNGQTSYSQVIPEVWTKLRNTVRPWLETYECQGQCQSPWLQADMEPAAEMLRLWVTNLTILDGEVKCYDSGASIQPLNLLWNWYVECMCKVQVPAHVLTVVHKHLIDASWVEFIPTLTDLENFNLVLEKGNVQCIDFVTELVCTVPWLKYYKEILAPRFSQQGFDIGVSYHVQLFHLFVTLPAVARNKELELSEVLSTMENCQWDIIGASNYQHTAQAFKQLCYAGCILAQRSHPSVMPLRFLRKAAAFLSQIDTASDITLHPETPVKRVVYVESIIALFCKCSSTSDEGENEINEDLVKVSFSNLITDVETVVSTVKETTEQKQLALSLCTEIVNILNLCYRDKAPMFLNTLLEWIDHSPKSNLLEALIAASCRSLVYLPYMLQLTERCIDAHFSSGNLEEIQSLNWGVILANLQVPELNLQEFVTECVNQGAYLTLYIHVLQQLPLSQSLNDELEYCKKLVTWTQQAKPSTLNEHKLLLWWWQILKLSERQVQFGGAILDVIKVLHSLMSTAWSLGEDKDSTGFFGAIGLGKRSQLSVKFRVVAKCLGTFIAAQLSRSNTLRTTPADSAVVQRAPGSPTSSSPPKSPTQTKDEQRHYKMTNQCLNHLESLAVNNRAYAEYKSELQYAVEFVYSSENTILQASLLMKYFVTKLYTDQYSFCDIMNS